MICAEKTYQLNNLLATTMTYYIGAKSPMKLNCCLKTWIIYIYICMKRKNCFVRMSSDEEPTSTSIIHSVRVQSTYDRKNIKHRRRIVDRRVCQPNVIHLPDIWFAFYLPRQVIIFNMFSLIFISYFHHSRLYSCRPVIVEKSNKTTTTTVVKKIKKKKPKKRHRLRRRTSHTKSITELSCSWCLND